MKLTFFILKFTTLAAVFLFGAALISGSAFAASCCPPNQGLTEGDPGCPVTGPGAGGCTIRYTPVSATQCERDFYSRSGTKVTNVNTQCSSSEICEPSTDLCINKPGAAPAAPPAAPATVPQSLPLPASWLGGNIGVGGVVNPGLGLSFFTDNLVPFITGILVYLVIVLSLIFLIIGGIMYVLSSGAKEGVAKAKATITYALVGLALGISSFWILNVVSSALGVHLLK